MPYQMADPEELDKLISDAKAHVERTGVDKIDVPPGMMLLLISCGARVLSFNKPQASDKYPYLTEAIYAAGPGDEGIPFVCSSEEPLPELKPGLVN